MSCRKIFQNINRIPIRKFSTNKENKSVEEFKEKTEFIVRKIVLPAAFGWLAGAVLFELFEHRQWSSPRRSL